MDCNPFRTFELFSFNVMRAEREISVLLLYGSTLFSLNPSHSSHAESAIALNVNIV